MSRQHYQLKAHMEGAGICEKHTNQSSLNVGYFCVLALIFHVLACVHLPMLVYKFLCE